MGLHTYTVPLNTHFMGSVARLILNELAQAEQPTHLAGLNVIVPSQVLVPALNEALSIQAGGPMLLPTVNTLSGFLSNWANALSPLSDVQRQLLLYGQLRRQKWFDEAALWDVVCELTALFDQLTEYAVGLPETVQALTEQLANGFDLKSSELIAFEARVVHTLWQAEAHGAPSLAAAQVVAAANWAKTLVEKSSQSKRLQPLCVLAEQMPSAHTTPLLSRLIDECSRHFPVVLCVPERVSGQEALTHVLNAAWPVDETSLRLKDRAESIGSHEINHTLQTVKFSTADSLESLAISITEQVCDWVAQGKQRIALVAADRMVARRVRALLERHDILVEDETGWKLSTTRAAATVDAWIETLSSDAYHRALIDLLKSPFIFADEPKQAAEGALQVERLLSREGIVNGIDNIAKALAEKGAQAKAGAHLLTRICQARTVMPAGGSASIHQWLTRLEKALGLLGALGALEKDAAGKEWLTWLREKRAHLLEDEKETSNAQKFTLTLWRQWFNREMDAALFRDTQIDSSVIMTHIAATRLRCFEAAIVIGADSEHLCPRQAPGWLTHEGVRRELGIPGKSVEKMRLREDLAGLMLCSCEVVFAWQSMQREELLFSRS